jgi:PhnB protein
MKTVNIPEGYQQIMPYLIVENASGFIEFTQKVFDAEETSKTMRTENVIMHAEIKIGNSVIMLADANKQFSPRPAGLFIYVDDCDAIYQKALNNGATTTTPPADQSYGRSAGVQDAYGNTWWMTSVA